MRPSDLGQFELLVVLAVLRLDNSAYGLQVQAELRTRLGREVALGAIYTTLSRLERKKLVTSKIGDEQSDRMGRPRRYFAISAAGVRAAQESQEAIRKMAGGLKIAFGKGV
jgi:PadR family transcriptional regulator, regulatory protein PadR